MACVTETKEAKRTGQWVGETGKHEQARNAAVMKYDSKKPIGDSSHCSRHGEMLRGALIFGHESINTCSAVHIYL